MRASSRKASSSHDKPVAFVTIEEDYLEFHGQIYYTWRAEGAGAWNFKLTPYKQLPYIKWKKLSEVEYNDRLRRYGTEAVDSRKQIGDSSEQSASTGASS